MDYGLFMKIEEFVTFLTTDFMNVVFVSGILLVYYLITRMLCISYDCKSVLLSMSSYMSILLLAWELSLSVPIYIGKIGKSLAKDYNTARAEIHSTYFSPNLSNTKSNIKISQMIDEYTTPLSELKELSTNFK